MTKKLPKAKPEKVVVKRALYHTTHDRIYWMLVILACGAVFCVIIMAYLFLHKR